ncbi:hypothetical protein BpHYR1_025935 [Brachionus plicatilis]|uniref:Uncharacterized protein n=1 Tax=Brachionus plicatilis TaxID=10195 RepID=A0A3M7SMV5_BRAPC|nr:hypothetical protein BpHYR1_025935 [Brachionus plicatilis]
MCAISKKLALGIHFWKIIHHNVSTLPYNLSEHFGGYKVQYHVCLDEVKFLESIMTRNYLKSDKKLINLMQRHIENYMNFYLNDNLYTLWILNLSLNKHLKKMLHIKKNCHKPHHELKLGTNTRFN